MKTCPSNALMYAEREIIIAEAHRRATALQSRYPAAQVYGETELGGLGLVMVLPDKPELLDLPINPQISPMLNTWQNVVQPASVGFIGFSLAFTGLAAIIARRNHKQEMARLHARNTAEEVAPEQPEHDENVLLPNPPLQREGEGKGTDQTSASEGGTEAEAISESISKEVEQSSRTTARMKTRSVKL